MNQNGRILPVTYRNCVLLTTDVLPTLQYFFISCLAFLHHGKNVIMIHSPPIVYHLLYTLFLLCHNCSQCNCPIISLSMIGKKLSKKERKAAAKSRWSDQLDFFHPSGFSKKHRTHQCQLVSNLGVAC